MTPEQINSIRAAIDAAGDALTVLYDAAHSATPPTLGQAGDFYITAGNVYNAIIQAQRAAQKG